MLKGKGKKKEELKAGILPKTWLRLWEYLMLN